MQLLGGVVALCGLMAAGLGLVYDQDIDLAFKKGESVDVFVHFPQYDRSDAHIFSSPSLTRSSRRQLVRDSRHLHNLKFQPNMTSFLSSQGASFQSFWITNSILVKDASPALVKALSAFPEVVELELNKITAYIIDPMVHSQEESSSSSSSFRRAEWNVDIINTQKAWDVTQGKGIVVSNIDTGVRHTHESLIDNYRGNLGNGRFDHDYNWFDPRGQQAPFDNNGHGTHTMGTLAGSAASGIGVAPGSTWIAAKGCASSSCATADLIASAEYVLCPTRQGGAGENCDLGADLVSNSWGGGRGSSTYQTYIQAWIDAGMIPLFSQGNSGSSCSTANSPGDLAIVIGVGSTNRNDQLSSFSSRGPGVGTATHPLLKPDISAPGEQVRSAYPTSDSAYATLSGTSMACPAAAGVTALVMSANPGLTYDKIREILITTTRTDLPAPNGGQSTCSGVSYTQVPNYHYGYGRIDAAAAVAAAVAYKA